MWLGEGDEGEGAGWGLGEEGGCWVGGGRGTSWSWSCLVDGGKAGALGAVRTCKDRNVD